MPTESLVVEMPTHLDRADRPLFGRTTRELLVITGGLFCALGALQQPHVPLGLRLGEGALVAGLIALLVWCRPAGRSLTTWGRVVLAYATGPRLLTWSAATAHDGGEESLPPPHLAETGWLAPAVPDLVATASAPGNALDHVRSASRAIQGHRIVPARIADGIVTFSDGWRCAILECSGENTGLMDTEALRGVHATYHALLTSLSFPVQMVVYATPIDLRAQGVAHEQRLAHLSLPVRRLESADRAYLEREARRRGLLDHRVFVVIPAPRLERLVSGRLARGPRTLWRGHRPSASLDDDGPRLLRERRERLMAALSAARVHVWRPPDADLEELWYRLLCLRAALVQPWDLGHADPVVWPTVAFPPMDSWGADHSASNRVGRSVGDRGEHSRDSAYDRGDIHG